MLLDPRTQPDFVMTDSYGRRMRKLRLSLLDACNFRCVYCMPEHATFLKEAEWLDVSTLSKMVGNFVRLGIEEIRLTGGEPTLRKDLVEIAEQISKFPLKKFGLTTNAYKLFDHLDGLQNTKLNSLNISLDTLNEKKFFQITKRDAFKQVMRSIEKAKELGFNIKINAVAMRGINDDEIMDFIRFSSQNEIEVRFLEVMNIGVVRPHFKDWFIPAQEMVTRMRDQYQLEPVEVSPDSTSFIYSLDNGAKIGFIASESKPFCGECSRLRLDVKGVLRPCLFKEEGISFAGVEFDRYPELIKKVLKLKPMDRIPELVQPMYQVGG